ncbi:MAG: hypothetical protein ACR2MD_10775, partial [Aridibacter sp.]
YGIRDFQVQYWNGSAWVTIQSVTQNINIWNQFNFSPVTTTRVRVVITNALAGYSRLTEIEAIGGN